MTKAARTLLVMLVLCGPAGALLAADEDAPATTQSAPSLSLFHDPADGDFDISGFLSTKSGFLPIVVPITEPAVGFGLGGGLTFFDKPPRAVQTPDGPRMIPPNTTIVGGMATENGSYAGFAAHLHTWNDGRIRYLIAGGYGSLNLDWFGEGNAFAGRSFSYNIDAWMLIQKLTFKLGDTDFFFGPTQRFMTTRSQFDRPDQVPAPGPELGIFSDELDSKVSGLGISLGYDTRNSLFSPTRGTKATFDFTQNDPAIGSDFQYCRAEAEVCQYVPLGGAFTLGMRGDVQYVSDDAPFYDLASINLRGIQAGRYVDNAAMTFEAELRWDIARRWTLVGFGGVGWVAGKMDELDNVDAHWAEGVGFRYLIARKYDMRLGCDIAHGPDDWAFYITVGTGWLRD